MMKTKSLLLLSCFLFLAPGNLAYSASATSNTDQPVPMRIRVLPPIKGGPAKAPSVVFYIYQEDNIFTFGEQYAGCTVYLLDNDNRTIYSGVIDESGVLEISLQNAGIYELQLVVDETIYYANIEL